MRTPTLLLVVAALVLAGCAARGNEDPFAYMRKPLYAGHFDLADAQGTTATNKFWVDDGSIAQIRIQVWVNNTAGDARVVIKDPSNFTVLDTTSSVEQRFGLDLGAWTVTVEGSPEAAGNVGVLVTRV